MCVTSNSGGSESASTAKPWFCVVISTRPVAGSTRADWPRDGRTSICTSCPAGQGQQLMPQADAEDRLLAQQVADRLLGVAERLGIAGAVGEEHAVGLQCQDSPAVAVPGRMVTRQPMSNKCRAMFHFMP